MLTGLASYDGAVAETTNTRAGTVPVLIPAYQPGPQLELLVNDLLELGCPAIVVVDDGSGSECKEIFTGIALPGSVCVVRHAVNLAKGAALKTGMNHVLVHFPGCCGVVTADADGQHHAEDILRVAAHLRENPEVLVMRALTGPKLSDTQTGLRGIPAPLIPHLLRLPSAGYDFELDMLLACKYQSCHIVEEPIRTIYLDGSKSSHFDPILDSMRIYLLLFRFSILSFVAAVLDNIVFALAHASGASIAQSQIAARGVAMVFNYLGARGAVFHSPDGRGNLVYCQLCDSEGFCVFKA
jgi:glycosyltransferase involved in cell wall biosynthesis